MSTAADGQSIQDHIADFFCEDRFFVLEIGFQHGSGSGGITDIPLFRSGFGQFEISLEIFIVQDDRFGNRNL